MSSKRPIAAQPGGQFGHKRADPVFGRIFAGWLLSMFPPRLPDD
jgi:hypothetical protein